MATCDVCGYEDKSRLKTAVILSRDGVVRCEKCRNIAMFGEPWPDEDTAAVRMRDDDYNKDAETFPGSWEKTRAIERQPPAAGKPYTPGQSGLFKRRDGTEFNERKR